MEDGEINIEKMRAGNPNARGARRRRQRKSPDVKLEGRESGRERGGAGRGRSAAPLLEYPITKVRRVATYTLEMNERDDSGERREHAHN